MLEKPDFKAVAQQLARDIVLTAHREQLEIIELQTRQYRRNGTVAERKT